MQKIYVRLCALSAYTCNLQYRKCSRITLYVCADVCACVPALAWANARRYAKHARIERDENV